MGHSVDVVERGRFKYPTVMTINTKKMGSGVDSVADTMGNLNNAYGRMVVMAPEVRKFYDSRIAKDHTNSRISELSMAQLYGSGLPMLPNGKIDIEASNHQLTAGTMLIRTEHMKQASHSDESKAWMANFETTQNDSGQGTGNEKEGWQTTRGMMSRTYVRMFGAPVILIAGNRQDEAFPPSTLGGGRIQSICSSVMDKTGQLIVLSSRHAEGVSGARKRDRGEDMYNAFLRGGAGKRAKASNLWQTIENAEARDTVPMREISATMVEQNVRYFFLRHLWRKALPFLHRTMTLGMVLGEYDLFSSFPNMVISVRGLTDGLRRNYLVDDTSFKRNVTGPWQTVSAFSTFGMQISEWCTGRAIRAATDRVDLFKAFQDMIFAFLNVPITFTAKLSSLHSWLFTNVLDISSMTLFGYMMYITGFRSHCPLHVLALAARGIELSDEQNVQYEAFCETIVHLVMTSVPGVTDKGPLSGVRNVRKGVLKEVTLETLGRWFNWSSSNEGLMAAREARQHDKEISAYVAPSMLFVSRGKADWARKQGKTEEADEYTAGTSTRMLAHAYALEQSQEAHKRRVERGVALLPFHYPHEYWEAVHKGTRMPRPDPEMGKMDRYELTFDSVWETGYWYEQVIRRLGGCRGLMKHFLVLCGLDEDTSLREFMIVLLSPYLRKRVSERSDVKFHNTGEWNAPILACKEVFAWGAQPHTRDRKIEGVEVILSMRLAYYVVAQGLVCRGWTRGKDSYSVVAHLCNMAHMSLELLMMFVHTRVEKAVIAANDGTLALPQRSPYDGGGMAFVVFDERLHVDSIENVNNMLCMRARQSSEWAVLGGDNAFIVYKSTCDLSDTNTLLDEVPFPFPPESVSHMQTHFTVMKRCNNNIRTVNPMQAVGYGNLLALAMRLYGCNTTSDMVSYIPATLTQCVTREEREIPCITYACGYMFCLKFESRERKLRLFPVQPTYGWNQNDEDVNGELFCELPVKNSVSFPSFLLGDVMVRGIREQDDGSIVVNPSATGKPHPFYFFPVVHWPHLVLIDVEQVMVTCKLDVDSAVLDDIQLADLRIMPVDEWLTALPCRKAPEQELEAWFRENSDVPKISKPVKCVSMFPCNDTPYFCVESEDGKKLVLMGKEHLKFFLERPAARYFDGEWVYCGHVLDLGDEVLPLKKRSDGIILAEAYDFNNEEYEICMKAIQAETKALNMLDDNIRRTMQEGRQTEELVHSRAQRTLIRQQLREKLPKCETKATVRMRLLLGEELKTWKTATPPTSESTATLGLVQAHKGTENFLVNGCYNITHADWRCRDTEVVETTTDMDFVTMSRCILREGAAMWMRVDQQAMRLLSALGFHPRDDSDECMVSAGDVVAYLRVFYVLGGTAIDEHVLRARVRVLVSVAGSGLHVLSIRVFDDDGVQRLYPHRPEGRVHEVLEQIKPGDTSSGVIGSSLIENGE